VKPSGLSFTRMGPMLGSAWWGPYSRKSPAPQASPYSE